MEGPLIPDSGAPVYGRNRPISLDPSSDYTEIGMLRLVTVWLPGLMGDWQSVATSLYSAQLAIQCYSLPAQNAAEGMSSHATGFTGYSECIIR